MCINVGDIFGIQKVLEINVKNPNTKRHENSCKCECLLCHRISYRQKYLLKNGVASSCICRKSENATKRNFNQSSVAINNVYGNLIVREFLGFRYQQRGRKESWYRCECTNCGNLNYEVSGNNLQSGNCKSCGCVSSRGETVIAKILTENNIQFKKQYTFKDLKDKGLLRFDFAIFNNCGELLFLIEFDGRQHYYGPDAKWRESDSFEEIRYRDSLKNEYCKNNHIKLKRIPYTEINNITIDNLFDDTWDCE